jgi:threonine/homoserine/homoserine lactone efflux protein
MKATAFTVSSVDTKPNSVIQGALINALSPHPYLFWIMVGSPIILNARAQGWGSVLCFVGSFYIALVGAKISLALIINRSRTFLQGRGYHYMMNGINFVLLIFACLLLREGWDLLAK